MSNEMTDAARDAVALMIAIAEHDATAATAIMNAYATDDPDDDQERLFRLVGQLAGQACGWLAQVLNPDDPDRCVFEADHSDVAEYLRRQLARHD